jgi:hypothetical protein
VAACVKNAARRGGLQHTFHKPYTRHAIPVDITPTHKGEHGIMRIQTIIMRTRTHSMQATPVDTCDMEFDNKWCLHVQHVVDDVHGKNTSLIATPFYAFVQAAIPS